jgi:hypothetical protein
MTLPNKVAVPRQRRNTKDAGPTDVEESDESSLAAQLGGEVAATLSKALERVTALTHTGRIDRAGLRALRAEIEHARHIGMMGQRVCHVASGRVRQNVERLDLPALLRQSLLQRGPEMESRGIEVRQVLRPAEVMGDVTLTFSFLLTLLDWCFEHACGRIDLTLDHQPWPAHARLVCKYAYRPADEVPNDSSPQEATNLATVSWRLLEQTAKVLQLPVTRAESNGQTLVTIGFPNTVVDTMEGVSTIELRGNTPPAARGIQPLSGKHVLVMSARRELRSLVREALKPIGLMLDFVTSVDEARDFCSGGMPHAILHEAALGGENFERLRSSALQEAPAMSFIQITEDAKAFEVRRIGDREVASIGRAAIMASLPSALIFELGRAS